MLMYCKKYIGIQRRVSHFFYEILVAASVECTSRTLALASCYEIPRARLRFVSSAHKMVTSLPIVDDNYDIIIGWLGRILVEFLHARLTLSRELASRRNEILVEKESARRASVHAATERLHLLSFCDISCRVT